MKFEFVHKPFDHQLEEFERFREEPARGILWEQGTGKTKLIIDSACLLYLEGKIDGLLVIAPNGVQFNWITDELPEHVPHAMRKQVRRMAWESKKATTKKHQEALHWLCKHDGFAILTMSFDAFKAEKGKAAAKKFLTSRRAMHVVDESHYMKTPGALITRTLMGSSSYSPMRRVMTGTPILKGPLDLYSPIKFLDKSFWEDRDLSPFDVYKRYFAIIEKIRLRGGMRMEKGDKRRPDKQWDHVVAYRNLDKLQAMLDPLTTRVLKDDVLDLPPKLYSKRYFTPTVEQMALYEQLQNDFMAELSTGDVLFAPEAIVRLLRFQQVLCNYLPTEPGGDFVHISERNPRLEVLLNVLEETPHKVIVWARFTEDINQIMRRCEEEGISAVRYDGQCSTSEAEHARQVFQKSPIDQGGPQVFVGNPAKGAEGLTLTAARTVVYYNNSFKLRERLQSEDRPHRPGQEHPVLYIDICAPDTVDMKVIENLRKKVDIASQITGDELKEWI